jgi:hypothetical protein
MNLNSGGKVISLSLFGNETKYTLGSLKFLTSAKRYLPNWKVVFFVGRSVPESHIQRLKFHGASVLRIDEPEGLSASSWRFRIWLLGNPSWVLFRDADSVLTLREARAVEQWVKSARAAHIIRDHPFHSAPILAGLWGLRPSFAEWFTKEVKEYSFTDDYGSDQDFLAKIVYPKVLDSSLVHASFHRHEQVGSLVTFQAGSSRVGSFCGESITSGLFTRGYARLRRLIDRKACSCER